MRRQLCGMVFAARGHKNSKWKIFQFISAAVFFFLAHAREGNREAASISGQIQEESSERPELGQRNRLERRRGGLGQSLMAATLPPLQNFDYFMVNWEWPPNVAFAVTTGTSTEMTVWIFCARQCMDPQFCEQTLGFEGCVIFKQEENTVRVCLHRARQLLPTQLFALRCRVVHCDAGICVMMQGLTRHGSLCQWCNPALAKYFLLTRPV